MLAGVRLGPGSRVRKLHLGAFPELQDIQDYLFELSSAPSGARVDLSFQAGYIPYTLTLSYSITAPVADWKLYCGAGTRSKLLWEHQTNDVTLVHNLVLYEIGESKGITCGEGKLSTIHGTMVTPEARQSAYVDGDFTNWLQHLSSWQRNFAP